MKKRLAAIAAFALVLTACSSPSDPLATESSDDVITIGTANFPESEIIGQVWAQALEDAGFQVEVTSAIGSREVYLRALEEGSVDLVPEYAGNLAQFYGADLPTGATPADVDTALSEVLPEGLSTGNLAEGESKDSYRVTRSLADDRGLTTLADLSKLDQVRIAANPELAERPYGPRGLTSVYNVDASTITMVPISDGGGPLTIAALTSGSADVADIYTTSPLLDSAGNEIDLVTLDDPEGLVLPQNVLPLMRSGALPDGAVDAINGASALLTTDALVAMNLRNIGKEKAEAPVIAREFLEENS
ncbi:Glycine betaine/carnitine/choline-binding protein OpuCC precursor [Corynebacterium atrinae]|uniref:ABC transporter substrate-binding protein n=1 Tax=Corynebacterium atrinae TaxID=1336740 RepID=UPI0025B5AEB2|nr:ABC transporter substrate-binding protein [Corynebacterium atrinae]WJY64458.1 Glycine betaine/carnitine/choline-binding protein OpuCC precursor [Corynebacterium atrinae]